MKLTKEMIAEFRECWPRSSKLPYATPSINEFNDLLDEVERLRNVTSPVLFWSHVPMGGDSGWNLLECHPDHPQQPVMRVTRGTRLDAGVTITCREVDGDAEVVIADVIVPFRDDLVACLICEGKGWVVSGGDAKEECPWCLGVKSTAMDEAREIACALYWSWLRSPNGRAMVAEKEE